mgnify:CR=1 FL=1
MTELRWRSARTVPKDGSRVLLVCEMEGGPFVFAARWDDAVQASGDYGRFAWTPDGGGDRIAEKCVTHWAPIPFIPKKRKPSTV